MASGEPPGHSAPAGRHISTGRERLCGRHISQSFFYGLLSHICIHQHHACWPDCCLIKNCISCSYNLWFWLMSALVQNPGKPWFLYKNSPTCCYILPTKSAVLTGFFESLKSQNSSEYVSCWFWNFLPVTLSFVFISSWSLWQNTVNCAGIESLCRIQWSDVASESIYQQW